jgi:hypothetical protein
VGFDSAKSVDPRLRNQRGQRSEQLCAYRRGPIPHARAVAFGIRHPIKLGRTYGMTMNILRIVPALFVVLLGQSGVENNLRFDCMSALLGIRPVAWGRQRPRLFIEGGSR